jgi:hypothetical protein
MLDAWQAATNRQMSALNELADGALADDESTGRGLATDLCSFWVGYWADAIDLLHETCSACVHPEPIETIAPPSVIAFDIESVAEAADPVILEGLTAADLPTLKTEALLNTESTASIPGRNVRVSTYRSKIRLSLVDLGPLKLATGVYEGNLDRSGAAFAIIRVTVT